jgi:hypothetical protein
VREPAKASRSLAFEELDHAVTPMGLISLRRRRMLSLDTEIFEVKLGDEFLMSSLFTAGETALARLGLERLAGESLDIAVGGLGLGFTAAAALDDPRVRSLLVLDAIEPVIDWHRRGLVPLGARLTGDARCELVLGSFFAFLRSPELGIDPRDPGRTFDGILLDIDHSPTALLHPDHAELYTTTGLARLAAQIRPGGVFAMWSNEPPDTAFQALLAAAFADQEARIIEFDNPLQGRVAAATVYLAAKAS